MFGARQMAARGRIAAAFWYFRLIHFVSICACSSSNSNNNHKSKAEAAYLPDSHANAMNENAKRDVKNE